jgi:replicative DNA helicase
MSIENELASDWQIPPLNGFEESSEVEVVPFPTHALPAEVSSFCTELARVTQAPIEITAAACLSNLSACLGKGVVIPNAFRGESSKPTLQFLIACESGTGKSTVFRPVMAPFNNWVATQKDAFNKNVLPSHTTRASILENEISSKTKLASRTTNSVDRDMLEVEITNKQSEFNALKSKMTFPAFLLEDCTIEAMAVVLGKNGETGQEAVFVISDDARQALATLLGKYTNGETTDNLLVKGYSWSPHIQNRRKDGGSVDLIGPCVNVSLMVQPDLLDRIISHPDLMHSGFLQRVILDEISWPAEEYSDPGEYDSAITSAWDSLVVSLLNFYRLAPEPHKVACTDEAKRLLIEYRNQLVHRIRNPGDLADVRSVADRWGEWAWRFALTFHCTIYGETAPEMPLEPQIAKNGIVLAEYYSNRKLSALYYTRDNRKNTIRTQILELAQDKEFIVAADVQRKRLARSAEEARLHLNQLHSAGHLKRLEIKCPGGGPTSFRYYQPEKFSQTHAMNVTNVTNDMNDAVSCPF